MLEQNVEHEFEVIVVNDSGQPLGEALWQRNPKVMLVNTHRRERCVARNVGASIARGRYLHFLDDDDWLLPDAFANLTSLADQSDGPWLFGGSQLIDRDGEPLIELHHAFANNCSVQVMSGEWIPMQATLLRAYREETFARGFEAANSSRNT